MCVCCVAGRIQFAYENPPPPSLTPEEFAATDTLLFTNVVVSPLFYSLIPVSPSLLPHRCIHAATLVFYTTSILKNVKYVLAREIRRRGSSDPGLL